MVIGGERACFQKMCKREREREEKEAEKRADRLGWPSHDHRAHPMSHLHENGLSPIKWFLPKPYSRKYERNALFFTSNYHLSLSPSLSLSLPFFETFNF